MAHRRDRAPLGAAPRGVRDQGYHFLSVKQAVRWEGPGRVCTGLTVLPPQVSKFLKAKRLPNLSSERRRNYRVPQKERKF